MGIAAIVDAKAKHRTTRKKWCATVMPLVVHLMPKGIASARAEQFAQPMADMRIVHTLAAVAVERGSTSCTRAVPVLANATEPGLGLFSRPRSHAISFFRRRPLSGASALIALLYPDSFLSNKRSRTGTERSH